MIELQEAEEGNAKRPRPRACRTPVKDASAKEDDEEWYDIHGDPMYDEDDEIVDVSPERDGSRNGIKSSVIIIFIISVLFLPF